MGAGAERFARRADRRLDDEGAAVVLPFDQSDAIAALEGGADRGPADPLDFAKVVLAEFGARRNAVFVRRQRQRQRIGDL